MSAHERRFVVRMRKIRRQREMSQADLARLTGLSRSLIANIETERREGLYVSEVFAIAGALGVDAFEMLAEAPMSLRIEVPVD